MAAPNLDPLIQAMTRLVTAMQAQQALASPPRESNVAKIDPFYGNEQDPISWLEEFEKACTANNYTDNRKLQVVQAHLKSTAATWLHGRQSNAATNPTTWTTGIHPTPQQVANSFKQPFIDYFRTESRVASWQHELINHQQLSSTVEQYASKLRNLIRRVYPENNLPEQAQIAQFFQGLQPHLRFHIQTASPRTLEDAIAAARQFESVYQQNPQQAMHQMMYQPTVADTPSKDKELAEALKGIQQQLQGLNRQNQQQRRPDYR